MPRGERNSPRPDHAEIDPRAFTPAAGSARRVRMNEAGPEPVTGDLRERGLVDHDRDFVPIEPAHHEAERIFQRGARARLVEDDRVGHRVPIEAGLTREIESLGELASSLLVTTPVEVCAEQPEQTPGSSAAELPELLGALERRLQVEGKPAEARPPPRLPPAHQRAHRILGQRRVTRTDPVPIRFPEQ